MKTSKVRRIGSALLAAAIAVSAYAGTSLSVFAADSWPNDTASAEPTFSGYRVKDIKNWSPETDPYAEFMRADVPLQNRNEAFKETQAKPYLNSDAEVMLMQGDYGNSFFGSTMYTNEFSEHVLNFCSMQIIIHHGTVRQQLIRRIPFMIRLRATGVQEALNSALLISPTRLTPMQRTKTALCRLPASILIPPSVRDRPVPIWSKKTARGISRLQIS